MLRRVVESGGAAARTQSDWTFRGSEPLKDVAMLSLDWWRTSSHRERLAGWRELHRQGQLVRYIAARVLTSTGASRMFLIRRRDFQLRFYPSSISVALWIDPDGRDDDEEVLRRYLRPGDFVVDIGANVGNLTLQAVSCVGESGHVVAVEPHPRTFGYLRGNLALNHAENVEALNLAIGDHVGTVCFSSRRQDDQNGIVSDGRGLTIQMRPLDMVVPPTARIALLKIDVEGYERFVLAGAADTLRRTDCVFFEAFDTTFAQFGYSTADLLEMLAATGFMPYRFDERGELVAIPLTYRAVRCENLLAIRDVDYVRTRLDRR